MHASFAAAVLAAAFLLAGCVTQQGGKTESTRLQRVPIGKPEALKTGAAFRVFARTEAVISKQSMEEQLFAATKTKDEEARRATQELAARIAEKSAAHSADELAWNLAANIEGTISLVYHVAFVRALEESDARVQLDHDKLQVAFRVSTRETAVHSVNYATFMLDTTRRALAEAFVRFPAPPALSGRYTLVTIDECPVRDGRYRVTQRGRVLEMRDTEDNILLYGVVGASRAFFVPNDQRYASVERRNGVIVDVRAPDTNADVIQADLAVTQPDIIALQGMPSGGCRGELRPLEIAS